MERIRTERRIRRCWPDRSSKAADLPEDSRMADEGDAEEARRPGGDGGPRGNAARD